MKTIALVGVLAGAVFLSYRNTLAGEFIYDDRPIIAQNTLIQSLARVPLLFVTDYWNASFEHPKESRGGLYRPLTMTTYALNYRIGGLNPRSYHLVNLLLHFGVCLLLWRLGLRWGLSQTGAFAASLLFAVLPIHTEAVSNITGRAELLSAFFVLASWILVAGHSELPRVCLGGLCFVLALLSKENSAALVPVLILSDGVLARRSWKEAAKERLLVWMVYGGLLLLYLEWRYCILGNAFSVGGIPYFLFRNRLMIALTMAKFTCQHYLAPLLLGWGLCADYTRPALHDAALRNPSTWGYAILLYGTLGGAFYFALKRKDRTALAILIFFTLLIPVFNLLVPLEVIGAERFLYLPSIGCCVAFGVLLEKALKTAGPMRTWALGMTIGLCLGYGWETYQRNNVWKTEEAFWRSTLDRVPQNPRAWNGVGLALLHQGKYDEAIDHFKRALALNSLLRDAASNIAECHFAKGDFRQAKAEFLALLQSNPYDHTALLYSAALAEKEHAFRTAASYYLTMLNMNPFDRTARRNLALVHCRAGDLVRCRSELQAYLHEARPAEQNEDIQAFLKKWPG